MSRIEVKCVDQTLTVVNAPLIASGDIQTDSVHFEFCDNWTGFAKFGVFYRDEDHVYKVTINESTKVCIIPKEVLQDEGIVYFGVFGVKGSGSSIERKTSEVLRYRIKQGVLTDGTTPSTPTPDIYEQILTHYAELVAQAHVFTPLTDEELDEIFAGTYVPTGDDDPSTRENVYAEVVTARDGKASLDERLDADFNFLEKESANQKSEIENLKAKAEGKLYRTETVEAEAYALDVPSSVAPYAEVQKIGGKSVVWNQLRNEYNIGTKNGITISSNDDGTINIQGTATSTPIYNQFTITNNIFFKRDGRKYLITSNLNIPNGIGISGYYTFGTKDFIFSNDAGSDWETSVFVQVTEGDVLNISNLAINIIDLTLMFGSGNEPTLEECKKIFSEDYYPYDAGTIKSFPVRTVKSVGKNLFDKSKATIGVALGKGGDPYTDSSMAISDFIPVEEGKNYSFSNSYWYNWFDESKVNKSQNTAVNTSAPSGVRYVRVSFLQSKLDSMMVEQSDSPTAYTPYMESTLDLSSLTSDLKSAGSVHDEWENGKVTKRIGVVDMGTLDWRYDSQYTRFIAFVPTKKLVLDVRRESLPNTRYLSITDGRGVDEVPTGCIYSGTTKEIFVVDTAYTNASTFKASLNGVMLLYELETPTEEIVSEIDNFIQVEGGGTLTFESDDTVHMPVPSTDRFVVDLS